MSFWTYCVSLKSVSSRKTSFGGIWTISEDNKLSDADTSAAGDLIVELVEAERYEDARA